MPFRYNTIDMKLARNIVKLKRMDKTDDSFMDASPAERVSAVWEITRELWSLRAKERAEQRLQRNAANLVRQ